MKKKILAVLLCIVLAVSLAAPVFAAGEEIVVYYTNDIHTYIANGEDALTYSKVAALKKSTENAILVDAGDHIQGTAFGGMDNGATIVKLMNATGYDAATLGNHEFDYGMEGCLATVDAANYPYTSCNFLNEEDGVTGNYVLDPYVMKEVAGKKIAFIGITTPETFTSSTPTYFQDGNGNYIYAILGGSDGSALYASVQNAIDAAGDAGADYIIGLGHLGVDPSSHPWTSREVIANTTGLDAFIDGHSHTTIASEQVKDASGNPVNLTQTGSYLSAVGKLTIASDGTLSSTLLTAEDLASLTPDETVKAIEDAWVEEINTKLGTVIGYADITLDNYDSEGKRLVRKQSTNTGDFSADALYYMFDQMGIDVDAAVMNGGGIRNNAVTGPMSYLTCKEIHTFGNVACLLTVSGQQLLDALEWSTRELVAEGIAETGSFLHVAGMKYTIDLTIPSTVQYDDKGVWTGSPTGEYRVSNVQILNKESGKYEPLDLKASYNLAGYNYTLRDMGGGFAMFEGAVNVLDYVAEDYMVLANYVKSFPVDEKTGLPTIGADSGYSDPNGSGRITIINGSEEAAESEDGATYIVMPGDSLWKIAQSLYGSGKEWTAIFEANRDTVRNPDLIYAGQTLTIPAK